MRGNGSFEAARALPRLVLAALVALVTTGCPPDADEVSESTEPATELPGIDPGGPPAAAPTFERVALRMRTQGSGFQLQTDDGWEPFFMNGINFGLAQPGKNPGELVQDRDDIARWLELAGELGVNTIRTYTLQMPEFYEEFAAYQVRHPDRPLWLVQGIWLDELELESYWESADGFDQEIDYVVDSLHGNAEIDVRFGKAFGSFTTDVSSYVIAWVIGRELDPYQVEGTNILDAPITDYEGDYLSVLGQSAMEVFACRAMDRVLARSDSRYGTQRPVSFSNWPTLDPIDHPTEPDPPISEEDFEELDTAEFVRGPNNDAGFFATYHAYPYFPEFIIYDPDYLKVTDEDGLNSYLGYLEDLKAHYKDIPIIVGEYGVPSSRGVAKFAATGLHHGGHNEIDQGLGNLRILRNIVSSGMAGGVLFALMDEWFKRSWVTERLEVPAERRLTWFNAMNPEQNFGVIAMEPAFEGTRQLDGRTADWTGEPLSTGDGAVSAVWGSADAQYFFSRIDVDPALLDWSRYTLYVGLNTVRDELGDSRFPDGLDAASPVGMEFVARIDGEDTAELLVDREYDTYGIWHGEFTETQRLKPVQNDDGEYAQMLALVNYEAYLDGELFRPRLNQVIGTLRHGTADPADLAFDSLADFSVNYDDGVIELRLPWSLLNFTDPSQREVLFDDRDTPDREVAQTDRVQIVVALAEKGAGGAVTLVDQVGPGAGVTWSVWDDPPFRERLKQSYYLMQAGMREIEFLPGSETSAEDPEAQ